VFIPAKLPERTAAEGTVMKLTAGVVWLMAFSIPKKKKV